MKIHTSYYFEDLQLKKFKGDNFLASTTKTNETALEINIQLTATTSVVKKSVEIPINRFKYMEKNRNSLMCQKCKRPIVINSEKSFLKCSNCRTLQRSADLQHSWKSTLQYCNTAGEDVSEFCNSDVVKTILVWAEKRQKMEAEEDIEISFLELSCIIITLSNGVIIKIRKCCDEDEFEDVASSQVMNVV